MPEEDDLEGYWRAVRGKPEPEEPVASSFWQPITLEAPVFGPVLAALGPTFTTSSGVVFNPTTTSFAFCVIPDMTHIFEVRSYESRDLIFDGWFSLQTGDYWSMALFMDGVEVPYTRRTVSNLGLTRVTINIPQHHLLPGYHTLDARWAVHSGCARGEGTQRVIGVT